MMTPDIIEVTNYTKDGQCSRCGKCCTEFLPITEVELQRIKDYVKEHNIKDQRPTALIVDGLDLYCPFLGKDGCAIYPVRPKICRSFLCNKSKKQLEIERKLAISRGEYCYMRLEIFDDKRYIPMLKQIGIEFEFNEEDN